MYAGIIWADYTEHEGKATGSGLDLLVVFTLPLGGSDNWSQLRIISLVVND